MTGKSYGEEAEKGILLSPINDSFSVHVLQGAQNLGSVEPTRRRENALGFKSSQAGQNQPRYKTSQAGEGDEGACTCNYACTVHTVVILIIRTI